MHDRPRHRMNAMLRWLAAGLLAGLCLVTVRAADAVSLVLEPPGGAAPIPRAFFGIHVHNNDHQRNWPDIPVGSPRLWDAHVTWSALEPVKGQWHFDRLDETLAWAEGRGIEVLMTLGLTPRWASARPNEFSPYGPGMAAEPADMADWRNYVRRVAEHGKGRIAAYQVWNEANLPEFYSGSPAKLLELAAVARQEIKRADPKARLVMPSGAGLDHRVGWMPQMLAAGLRDTADVAAVHLYHGKEPPESVIEPVRRLLALKAAAGAASMPVWNTETGYTVATPQVAWRSEELRELLTPERVAEFLPRDMLLARALGFERYFWYDWDGSRMGMLDPQTGRHRPAADVYAQLIEALTGAVLHRCERASGGLWHCSLTAAGGGELHAYWTDGAASVQSPSLALGPVRQRLLDGRSGWRDVDGPVVVGPVVMLTMSQP